MTAPSIVSANLRHIGRQYLRLQRSLAQKFRLSLARRRTRAAACVGLLGLAFGGAALALVAGPNLRSYGSLEQTVRAPIAAPNLSEEIRAAVGVGDWRPVHVVARPGETLMSLFRASASTIPKPTNSSARPLKPNPSGCRRRAST